MQRGKGEVVVWRWGGGALCRVLNFAHPLGLPALLCAGAVGSPLLMLSVKTWPLSGLRFPHAPCEVGLPLSFRRLLLY